MYDPRSQRLAESLGDEFENFGISGDDACHQSPVRATSARMHHLLGTLIYHDEMGILQDDVDRHRLIRSHYAIVVVR
jgi:hypothetical protein